MDDFYTGTSVVLLYHRIGWPKLGSLVSGQYVAPKILKSGLDYLSNREWKCISLADCVEQLHTEQIKQENQFTITFDDGYLSVYEHACPIIIGRKMNATVYVVVNSIGGINDWDRRAGDQIEKMMSASQIREIADNGFEIGSHTLTHPHLTHVDDDQLIREVSDSKHKLEDIIGREVTSFSYPYGSCDNRVIKAAITAGYTSAVSTKLGVLVSGVDMFEIPRVNVRWNAVGPLLMRKIQRAEKASGIRK